MDSIELPVEPRTVLGKKVSNLRRKGLVPANVFGRGITSYPIQAEHKQLEQVLARAGTSRLVALKVPKERDTRRALVREVRRDPVTGQVLHVNFYQVNMTEKLKAEVHLVFAGEAPAAKGGVGVLLHNLSSLTVEALPGDLPKSIEVDLSNLEAVGDTVHVKDLAIPEGVTVLTEPDEVVARVVPVRVEREEKAAEAPEEVEEKKEAAPEAAAPEEEEAAG